MKQIFAVTVSLETMAMVYAESAAQAVAIAKREAREILRDCPQDVVVDVHGEIRSQSQLAKHGWDEMCLPYGGDGNTRLAEILPAGESS